MTSSAWWRADAVSEQENLGVVDRAYEAFGQGDVTGVLDLLAEDVHWSTPGPPEVIPYAGLRTGHEQVEGYFESFGGAVEVTEFEPQQFFAKDNMVVALGHYAFRVKSTGNAVETDWVHAFTLRDRKIVNFRGYEDSAAVANAFTAEPPTA
jgi:ketosteroid isomerase-like protein